ncbi:MAG TPA: Holliday junction resolvase RuvX [Gemmatimonadales bacterium]|nr:Holliday junction resolvase RuvX [Gemmatimonadales bacterium]
MAAIPSTGRILGVDWGEVRIGLAQSDESQILASPLETLVRRPGRRVPMPRLLELIGAGQPVGVVVGLPLTPEGDEGPAAAEARALGELIGRRAALTVAYWDERHTTARVLSVMKEQGSSARGQRGKVDALAAAVLLQGYLDYRRAGVTGGR